MSRPRAPARPAVLSAGIVPVLRTPEGERYLLLRAYNYWDFPKGVVGRREDPLAAALRELEEETTLTGAALRWGQEFRETPPYAKGKIARYYVGEVTRADVRLLPNPVLGIVEHHEFRWLSYPEARALVADRVKPILDWAHALVTGTAAG